MLKRCEDTNLALNWEKSHFMVKEGIVLGHKISKKGIEVDKAKINVISKLPHPTTVKGAVLGQRIEKHFRPIHYARKSTQTKEEVFKDVCITLGMIIRLSSFILVRIKSSVGLLELINLVMHRQDKAKFHFEMRCLKMLSPVPSVIFTIWVEARRFPDNDAREKTKEIHDSKIRNRIFNIGDQCLTCFNSDLRFFYGMPHSPDGMVLSPITEVFLYGTVPMVSYRLVLISKSNCHRLKNYMEGITPPLVSGSPRLSLRITKFKDRVKLVIR
ncbi:hypothetical protein Tco_0233495 [Tanacetum coccineum]